MTLSEISIRRPVFAWMLMAGLIIFGAISFNKLGMSQLPDVNFPVVSVSATLNGASPEVMESQVVDLIEDAIMGIQGIRNVNSTARQSSASISVEFEMSHDIDAAVQEIQSRMAQIQQMLPADLMPISIRKSNPEDQPIVWVTVTGDSTITRNQLMIFARDTLYDQFATVPGVGDIGLGGYVDANLRVWLSLPKLNKYQLTAADVIKSIQSEHIEIPAGRIENDKKEYNVRLMGEAHTPAEFGKIIVNARGGGPNFRALELRDIARVEEGLADVRKYSRYNGNFNIGLGILKQHGSNAVQVADDIKKKVEEVIPTLPKGYTLTLRVDNTKFIRDSVNELCMVLIFSAILTSLVCYLFLGSWTSTLNVLMAIPTSIVGAFTAIYFFGFTLNTFTLLGLSLAIGIVVDDAIMMLENIVRHRELGEDKMSAAIKGSKEITFAAMAATIAVVAIFLPVVFMDGVIGRYFYQYGVTVTIAVLLSLLEALTLTPMRCSRYLTVDNVRWGPTAWVDKGMISLEKWYARVLGNIVNHRKKILLLSLVAFAASMFVIRFIPSELQPAQDQSLFLLRVKLPVGSSLNVTDIKFKELEKYLSEIPEVNGYTSFVGGFGGDAVNEGQSFVTLVDRDQRKLSQAQIADKVRDEVKTRVKGAKISVQDLSLRGFAASRGYPVEFTIEGPDWGKLGELSDTMIADLEATNIVTDLNTDYQANMPEVKLVPIRTKLAEKGLALNDVATTVNTLIGGAVLNAATRYSFGGHRYDIRVRLEDAERVKAEQLNLLKVRNNRGELISIADVVKLEQTPSLQMIMRRNRERAITINGNMTAGHSQSEAMALVREEAKKVLPDGYHIDFGGNSKGLQESFRSLFIALILGIFVSYMVLASQFNSFLHPVMVLLALPFSISGAFLALWITHQSINMYSVIGLILLMGIVKKNSILLVDFTNQLRREGKSPLEAVLRACPVRLRPILMTSVATIVGAIPGALALGPGAETRIPMAIAIIGGVLLSTILTLFVVPCAYLVLMRFERRQI